LLDELLPVEVRELPAELSILDRLLADPRLLAPIEQAWEQTARDHGRPTIPMASFVRLMVIKQRTGWGYETLVREVSDSLRLRRFCLLPLTQRVPEKSTVRKLVRRRGPWRGGAAPEPSCARPDGWRSWLTVASGSSPRSSSDHVGRRSATGWCRWPTRTLARSARASSASPTSSATSPSSQRSPPTSAAAPAGYLLPATAAGNPGENRLLDQTAAELARLGLRPHEVALGRGFVPGPTAQTLAALAPTRTFISGRAEPGSRRTRKRLARYRTGCAGRISHLKRGYGLRRSRLKGDQGQRIWTGWAILAYNLDTLAIHTT
jgi:hypothetical protein